MGLSGLEWVSSVVLLSGNFRVLLPSFFLASRGHLHSLHLNVRNVELSPSHTNISLVLPFTFFFLLVMISTLVRTQGLPELSKIISSQGQLVSNLNFLLPCKQTYSQILGIKTRTSLRNYYSAYNRKVKSLSHVRLFVTPWTVAYHVPSSMGFSRQDYWSGLPFPFPEDLPDPGIEPGSPALKADTLPSEPPGRNYLLKLNFLCLMTL